MYLRIDDMHGVPPFVCRTTASLAAGHRASVKEQTAVDIVSLAGNKAGVI
jgi:hypothetical protein